MNSEAMKVSYFNENDDFFEGMIDSVSTPHYHSIKLKLTVILDSLRFRFSLRLSCRKNIPSIIKSTVFR